MPIATRAIAASVALGLTLTVAAGGCTKDRTPAELRHDKVQARLQDTFTDAQASCIMAKLDPATIKALAAGPDTGLTGAAADRYSSAVLACVTGASGPTSTTAPSTTTTAAATSTTKP